jgi:hypothetical protein
MIGYGSVLGIIMVLGALVLAASALRSHRLTFERTAQMAVAWIVIILVLVFVISRFGL